MADINGQGLITGSAIVRGDIGRVAPALGMQTWLGFGVESAYGTPATRTKFIEIVTEGIKLAHAPLPKASLRGPFSRGFFQGRKIIGGDIETELFYEGHEKLLLQLFGKVGTSLVETGVYDHVFEPQLNLPTGLTFEVNRDLRSFVYPGGKINSGTFTMALDQVLRATYSVVAKNETSGAASTPSFPSELLPVFHAADLKIDTVTQEVNDFNATLNNNLLTERFKLNSNTTKEPRRNDLATVEGTFTGDFNDMRQYDKFTAGTPVALQLVVLGDLIAATSSYYTVTIDIPRALYTGETPSVGGPGIIPQNFPFMGLISEDLATPAIKLTLRNTLSSV